MVVVVTEGGRAGTRCSRVSGRMLHGRRMNGLPHYAEDAYVVLCCIRLYTP